MEVMIGDAYVRRPTQNPDSKRFRELPGEWTSSLGVYSTTSLQNRSSSLQDPPRPHPMYLFLWSSSVAVIVSFNKLANVSKCFPEFCEPLRQIQWTWEGGRGNPQLVSKLDRSSGSPGCHGELLGAWGNLHTVGDQKRQNWSVLCE